MPSLRERKPAMGKASRANVGGASASERGTERAPGTATTSQLAVHWDVCPATARAIIERANLPDVSSSGRRRYRWEDVWRFEGAGVVPRCDWAEFKAPLLVASQLATHDPEGRAARTWRRHVKAGRMPSVRLADGVRKVRPCTFHAVAPYV